MLFNPGPADGWHEGPGKTLVHYVYHNVTLCDTELDLTTANHDNHPDLQCQSCKEKLKALQRGELQIP